MAFSILSRWVSRTPETALQELLDFVDLFFNGFWLENDVTRLTV